MTQIFRHPPSWESQVAKRLQEYSTRPNTGQRLPFHIDDSKLVYTRLKTLAKQIKSLVAVMNSSNVSTGNPPLNEEDIIKELELALKSRAPYTGCVCIERYVSIFSKNSDTV